MVQWTKAISCRMASTLASFVFMVRMCAVIPDRQGCELHKPDCGECEGPDFYAFLTVIPHGPHSVASKGVVVK